MVITKMLVAGSWLTTLESSPVSNPESGEEIARVPLADLNHVELAVQAANTALSNPFPLHHHIEVLEKAAGLIEDRSEEFARLIVTEGIKTTREAMMLDHLGKKAAGEAIVKVIEMAIA